MLLYKAEGIVKSGITTIERGHSRMDTCTMFSQLSDTFYTDHGGKIYIFISMLNQGKINAGIITAEPCDAQAYMAEYLGGADTVAELDIKEVTMNMFFNMLGSAGRMDFIPDIEYVVNLFGIERLKNRSRETQDIIIGSCDSKAGVYAKTRQTLCAAPLTEELDKIYNGKTYDKFMGNPVHYIIKTDSKGACDSVCETLLQGLYANSRIISRRYTVVDLDVKKLNHSAVELDSIYRANIGGTVYATIPYEGEKHGFFGSSTDTVAEIVKFCDVAKRYANKVLTVFGVNIVCTVAEKKIYECMENISFVEINEKTVFADGAKNYLTYLADKNELPTDEKLFSYIKDDVSYNARELDEWFLEWNDKKMKTELFPQYDTVQRCAVKIKNEEPQGCAYDELQKMIGLKEVKNTIDKALNYYKAQKMFERRGLKTNKNSMHMVFTGNPGTAKTTVARLFAQIMKDNGILPVGNLVEVGRADLVGKYVGQTAPLVKAKFKEALGSVLFIDEAYSLLDGDHNTFGVEAINTIVAEMENNREDIIVIFAGYPAEMKEFMDKNPGMKSRIAFHIGFDDYSADELYEITELMAQKQGMRFADDVREKLIPVFEAAGKDKSFGNGRYARNIFEKALMNQGTRLVNGNIDMLSNADMQLITAEDIDIPVTAEVKKKVGFAV